MPGIMIKRQTSPAASSPMRKAIGFRKLSGIADAAGGARARAGAGSAEPRSSDSSGRISSRWGFPHLWQKRASGGSWAPQVQNSGMYESEDLLTQFAAGSPTDARP